MDNKKGNRVDNQLTLIKRGAAELIPEKELKSKLREAERQKKNLKIKFGADPTAADLHLGHLVILRKLRQFQDLGHRVIFIIGDFTALIGDPSGKTETRPNLSPEEIKKNAATYQKQIFKVLNPDKTEVIFNSRWLGKMDISDFLRLSSHYTVARMLERDDFFKRYKDKKPITIREFLYPLLQGYDSVELQADVEIGGVDQKFNLLVGRELQREFNQPPQVVLTLPLLEGTDGVRKMSKSYGNYIGIDEPAEAMYGKIMSIPDSLMIKYFELLTDIEPPIIKKVKREISKGTLHPREAKERLAVEIVGTFYPEEEVEEAAQEFKRIYVDKSLPSRVKVIKKLPASLKKEIKGNSVWLVRFLTQTGLVSSGKKARALITQGGIKIDEEVIKTIDYHLDLSRDHVIKVGKHIFRKISAQ
ncbi:MAG: tyrosine--tRNA ligase [Candidatus Ratteibacteria bacterium]|nr:tyrosine--tRNA ligase [Candidatus Ratteibacteria bacterium]